MWPRCPNIALTFYRSRITLQQLIPSLPPTTAPRPLWDSQFPTFLFSSRSTVLITNISVITNPLPSPPPANFTGALSQGSPDKPGVCIEKTGAHLPAPGAHLSREQLWPRPAPAAGTGAAPPAGAAGLAPTPPTEPAAPVPLRGAFRREGTRQLSHRRSEQFPLFVCAARPGAPSARTGVPAPAAAPPGGAPRGRGVPVPPPPPSPAR